MSRRMDREEVTLSNVITASYCNRTRLKAFANAVADQDRKARRKAALCRCCYYVNTSRIGGAMCCSANCKGCGKELHSGSTWVDPLCLECGVRMSLCVRCTADLDDKNRRKL